MLARRSKIKLFCDFRLIEQIMMKTESSSQLEKLKRTILESLCGDEWTEEQVKMVRKLDKQFEKGDFSLPDLRSEKVWAGTKFKNNCVSDLISDIEHSRKFTFVHLNRKLLLKNYFTSSSATFLANVDQPVCEAIVVNFDRDKPNSSELTSARAERFSRCLANLPLPRGVLVGVSSTDLSSQINSYAVVNDKLNKVGIQVGAVIDEEKKKDVTTSLAEFTKRAYLAAKQLDDERCDPHEDCHSKQKRLETVVESSIQFNLLGSNITKPVQLVASNPNSNFVLYNSARVHQILSSFEENPDYPKLPLAADIDYGLLIETEEWELYFNFLLPFSDVLLDCVASSSLHKLVLFLVGLSNTFSRYFSRVKILREPLPHLIPTLHARICLVHHLDRLLVNALNILNLKSVAKM